MSMLHATYETGLVGTLTLTSAGELLDGCWFEAVWPRVARGLREPSGCHEPPQRRDDLPAFARATVWLDRYFAGDACDPRDLPLGGELTEFQRQARSSTRLLRKATSPPASPRGPGADSRRVRSGVPWVATRSASSCRATAWSAPTAA